MSQKLKRGGPSARAVAARADTGRKIRKARARTNSTFDRLLAALPFNEAQLHRLFLALILGVALALAWLVASMAGVPAMAREQDLEGAHLSLLVEHHQVVVGVVLHQRFCGARAPAAILRQVMSTSDTVGRNTLHGPAGQFS